MHPSIESVVAIQYYMLAASTQARQRKMHWDC